MKRNKLFILGICTVMVALVSLSLVSGTWAKYTSTVSGSDQARVAKWDVSYTGAGETVKGNKATQTIKFDLFNTVYDTNGGSEETNVEKPAGETLIAPGTKGSFSFTVTNASEVTAKCNITLAVTNEIEQLVYTFNGAEYQTVADLSAAVDAHVSGADMPWDTSSTIEIGWEWAYYVDETTDGKDIDLGLAPITTVVTATIVFTQVD